GMRTCLGVPLMRDDKVVGVLSLTRQEVRSFAPHEIAIVQTFADQAAIAIENVRLFNETKAALDQQTAVSEVLKTISDSAFDLQRVLETLVEQAARLCDAERGSIYRKDWPLYRTAAMWGPNITEEYRRLAVEARAPNRGSLVGRTALEGKVVHSIALAPNDLQPVLDTIAGSAARFCGASDVTVWLARGDELVPAARHGELPWTAGPVAFTRESVSGRAILERRTIHIADM